MDAGATAIQVSNHGGNNLDSTPAPIRVLPGIVEAVGREVEVILDGGIRRGSDVVKALALGARAVAIGRAYLWGLAANGQPGVENVFEILRSGIGSGLMGLGKSSVHELAPEDLDHPAELHPAGRELRPGSTRRAPPGIREGPFVSADPRSFGVWEPPGAVAVGFEPTVGRTHTRFRGALLWPLGHATADKITGRCPRADDRARSRP